MHRLGRRKRKSKRNQKIPKNRQNINIIETFVYPGKLKLSPPPSSASVSLLAMPAPKSVYTLEKKKSFHPIKKKSTKKVCNPPDINIQLSLVGEGGRDRYALNFFFFSSLPSPHISFPRFCIYRYIYISMKRDSSNQIFLHHATTLCFMRYALPQAAAREVAFACKSR